MYKLGIWYEGARVHTHTHTHFNTFRASSNCFVLLFMKITLYVKKKKVFFNKSVILNQFIIFIYL